MPSRVRLLQAELDAIHLQRENELLRDLYMKQTMALRDSTKLLHRLKPFGRPPISNDKKLYVAGLQRFRCANPYQTCPLHRLGDGTFDESGFECDHKEMWCSSLRSDISNLQCLCHMCHGLKSRLERIKKFDDEHVVCSGGGGGGGGGGGDGCDC